MDEGDTTLFLSPPDADDERGELTDEESEAEESRQIEALTAAAEADSARDADAALWAHEQRLLDRMQAVAEASRHLPDAKTRRFIDWIREHQCPGLPPFGQGPAGDPPQWSLRRVLIFTENREGTKRYLKNILEQAIEDTDRADERIEVIDGLTSGSRRKTVQRRFNADPAKDPLRILIATDAAREGLNFQAHCADLFHFDLPWNPGRIEQRNGRIDRKLQPAAEVNCHYFVLPQRVEDRVLEVLVRKTETIKKELGSLSRVIDDDVERRLRGGIRHRDADDLRSEIEAMDLEDDCKRATREELEATRERQHDLLVQIDRCETLLDRSRDWARFDAAPFREALSCSLELLGAPPLEESTDEDGRPVWTFPALDQRAATDPSWAATLDTLRVPRKTDEKLVDWRRVAPIRPVIFKDSGVLSEDTVHLHLEQRVAQRLLARFRAQGFVHHDLSQACLAQTKDSVPRVVLLGRLSLYGRRAERLHEDLVPVAARWIEPALRDMSNGKLLRQLIRSGAEGDLDAFRGVAKQVIAEERQKQHHLLANDLETILYGRSQTPSSPALRNLTATIPEDRERGIPLLSVREPVRGLEDVVLSSENLSAVKEILCEHNREEVLRAHGLRPSDRVLFCGPPGCGKTLTAEVIASELGRPLAIVRTDSVVSSFLGETAANLRKVFDFVAASPMVALFDEFDALGKEREDASEHGELRRVVNAVLQMLDAYEGRSLIIAATNHEDMLDSAIWRRFEEVLILKPPTVAQLRRLLSVKLRGVRREFAIDDVVGRGWFKGATHSDRHRSYGSTSSVRNISATISPNSSNMFSAAGTSSRTARFQSSSSIASPATCGSIRRKCSAPMSKPACLPSPVQFPVASQTS